MDDLRKITSKIKMDNLEQPVRIWTDYERFNRSHFWSETANEWWQSVNHGGFLEQWKFKDSVVVNGYKKFEKLSTSNEWLLHLCCQARNEMAL